MQSALDFLPIALYTYAPPIHRSRRREALRWRVGRRSPRARRYARRALGRPRDPARAALRPLCRELRLDWDWPRRVTPAAASSQEARLGGARTLLTGAICKNRKWSVARRRVFAGRADAVRRQTMVRRAALHALAFARGGRKRGRTRRRPNNTGNPACPLCRNMLSGPRKRSHNERNAQALFRRL